MIREAIINEMKLQGVTQAELVSKLNVKLTKARLSNFITGKASINIQVLDAILKYLNVELIRRVKYDG